MVDASQRKVKPGTEYDRYFRKPSYNDKVRRKNATVDHSIDYIAERAKQVTDQVKRISELLQGNGTRETCKKLFDFIMDYIAYERDAWGVEQVKDPVRLWADRKGDCDCYTLFMSAVLLSCGISHKLKVTGYTNESSLEHIYVVAFDEKGSEIAIDPVVGKFDYEHGPIKAVREIPMQVNVLAGFFNGCDTTCIPREPKVSTEVQTAFQKSQPNTPIRIGAESDRGTLTDMVGSSGSDQPRVPSKKETTAKNRWALPIGIGIAALAVYIIF